MSSAEPRATLREFSGIARRRAPERILLARAAVSEIAADSPFDHCVTIAPNEGFNRATIEPWTSAIQASWSMTVLIERFESGASAAVERVIHAVTEGRRDGRTLALLMGPSRDFALDARLRCSTLVLTPERPLRTILVAIGHPDHASRTLRAAACIASHSGAALVGVHSVANTSTAQRTGAVVAANARVAALGEARASFSDVLVEVDESPSAAIARCAERVEADLVVVGRRSTRAMIADALARSRSFSTLAVL